MPSPDSTVDTERLDTTTITVRVSAMQRVATALVGGPDANGGEYARFRDDVVRDAAPRVTEAATGPATTVREGNWFRDVATAEAAALVDFTDSAMHGVHALGNAAGYIAANYDDTDRSAGRLLDDPDAMLDLLERDGNPAGS
ncbi:hypothetical protein GCM10027280_24520 [Micromonospora polyrhachis]|uniref:Uncharacterized protein n=1 Tax=Micromonospora polyrhachis TaxID=1282883 RepID=A0A7W7WR34_9ACTN|nr:hypothetical protein [Micromonospora polyrhachis]MBB4960454.1 hypothetical protein [Micromonospora polyrhachis]